MSLPASAPVSVARPVVRWLRRIRWGVTGLLLLAALAWGGHWMWQQGQPTGVPVDWAAFWGGERLEGRARACVPLNPGSLYRPNLLLPDADGAYPVDELRPFGDLAQTWDLAIGTLAAWSRLEASSTNWPDFAYVVAGGAPYPNEWLLVRKPGRVGVMIGTPGPVPANWADLPMSPWEFTVPFEERPGEWVHLAASFDRWSGEVVLYAAGREVGRTHHPNPPSWWSPQLYLGSDPWGPTWPAGVRGQVDDLALYDRALRPTEVAALATAGRGGPLRVVDQLARLRAQAATVRSLLPGVAAWLGMAWGSPWVIGWWWQLFLGTAGRHRALVPVAGVLMFGLLATAGTTWLVATWLQDMAERRLAGEVKQFQELMDAHFEKTMTLLIAIRGQLPATGPVTKADWSWVLATPNLLEDFPQVWPLGYAEYVRPGARAEHEVRWREQLGLQHRIHSVAWDETAAPDAATNAALPVVLMKPPGMHTSPPRHPVRHWYLGRDLFATGLTDPTNRLLGQIALEGLTARRSAPPAEMFTSAVPGASFPGLMLFVPLPDSAKVADPRRGLLFAGSSPSSFLRSSYGITNGPDFGMRWFWERDDVAPLLAADSGDVWETTREPASPWLRNRAKILLYGARLQCDFWTTPLFDQQNHRRVPWFIALAGVLISMLGAGFVAGQVRARLTETAVAENLRGLNAELAAATKERARLSRDLHDGTIQNLYAVGLELGQARALIKADPPRAEAELGHTLTTLQAAITELRQFVLELEPEAWQGQTVRNALDSLLARLRRTTALEFHLSISPVADALPAKTAIHVLQLVREGLSNVLRHADARNVWVELGRSGRREEAHDLLGTQVAGTVMGSQSLLTSAPIGGEGAWTLEIRDDGRGFDVPTKAGNGGRGLRNFLERAAELGGRCEVRSAAGTGSRIMVTFPQPPRS